MATTQSRSTTTREFMLGEGTGTGAGAERMQLGLGPQHPAMHGIIRINTELDGEVIVKSDVEIGYRHRAFEKDCEVGGWNNAISYGRVGGVKADLPDGFAAQAKKAFAETRVVLAEVHRLLTGNRIFMDRMVGIGTLSREETIAYAITGPLLRAVGVGYDVRRAE